MDDPCTDIGARDNWALCCAASGGNVPLMQRLLHFPKIASSDTDELVPYAIEGGIETLKIALSCLDDTATLKKALSVRQIIAIRAEASL